MPGNCCAPVVLTFLLAFALADVSSAAIPGCAAGSSALTLQDGRFHVEVTRQDSLGKTHPSQAMCLTRTSGTFSFFQAGIADVAVKVVDGRVVNDAFWVFHAGLTDAAYEIVVTDQITAIQEVYEKPAGDPLSASDLTTFLAPGMVTAPATVPLPSPASSAGELVADFFIDPDIAGVGQTVTFKDRSVGMPAQWCWFFGDGTSTCCDSPACSVAKHTYSTAGTYSVKLQVGRSEGISFVIREAFRTITVQECSFRLSGPAREFGPEAKLSSVTVKASPGCPRWEVYSENSRVVETYGATRYPAGAGEFTVRFKVLENPENNRRSGTLNIAGQTFTVNQRANVKAPCKPDPTTLCLLGGRFEVRTRFSHPGIKKVDGKTLKTENGSSIGAFWVFDKESLDLVVKMVDGRPVNGHYWFFYAGLTHLEYTITVRDTVTGRKKAYQNMFNRLTSRGYTEEFR